MLSKMLLAHCRWWERDKIKHGNDASDEAYSKYVEELSVLEFLNELSMFEDEN